MRAKAKSLAVEIQNGNRSALAKAITLMESSTSQDRIDAELMLKEILPITGKSMRLGVTGIPGVGKSTFIEKIGLHALHAGYRVAVLTIDPSSVRSKGSILGDKTRMGDLAFHKNVFIRPSPSGASKGGVADRTRECIYICEAAGFDLIIVETVGVGQVELSVAGITDIVLLLLLPATGDELQGLKRGSVELADFILVNKADGEMRNAALRTVSDYRQATHLLSNPGHTEKKEVMSISALDDSGVLDVFNATIDLHLLFVKNQVLNQRRAAQAKNWLAQSVREILLTSMDREPSSYDHWSKLEDEVAQGRMTALSA
ncbi:MAG: methylmalonyl Co-A mutase-associated GTPase MeaB, partial [Acidiferrobacteraceae bacterium]|nr:methylmalonyl Co-A mutase-associated GTPase MeaB [Acidiferrobacteraceae bacterium]